jgi:hypothetical protein
MQAILKLVFLLLLDVLKEDTGDGKRKCCSGVDI